MDMTRRLTAQRARALPKEEANRIGLRLRAAREAKELSLRGLASSIDVSASLLSQIENGQANPSVDTLFALSEALAVPVAYFFDVDEDGRLSSSGHVKRSPVVPRSKRQRMELDRGVVWESLLTEEEAGLEWMVIHYPPGAVSSTNMQRHPGRDYGIVIEGVLTVRVGFAEYTLGQGDSISLDATTPHQLSNRGEISVEAVWLRLDRGALK